MMQRAALHVDTGDVLDAAAWLDDADPVDARVLHHVVGPALDIGCGPGRHVVALAERGVVALGIDIALSALNVARTRGAITLERSVFSRVPASGRWRTALLLDGNLGIGGDPETLLRRVRELLMSGGSAIVEADADTVLRATRTVRLEIWGAPGPWFELVPVAIDDIAGLARRTDFAVASEWSDSGRHFAHLVSR
jgi:SAM-dependent methyltransferase